MYYHSDLYPNPQAQGLWPMCRGCITENLAPVRCFVGSLCEPNCADCRPAVRLEMGQLLKRVFELALVRCLNSPGELKI